MPYFCFINSYLRLLCHKHKWSILVGAIILLLIWNAKRYKIFTTREQDIMQESLFDYYVKRNFIFENVSEEACVQPNLRPYHSSFAGFFHDVTNLVCDVKLNWITVENGTFEISSEAKKIYGKIRCQFASVERKVGNDNLTVTGNKQFMTNTLMKTPSDFFKVSCISENRTRYLNVHATIAYDSAKHNRTPKIIHRNSMGLSVLMFGFDSVSRMTWHRKLRKSRDYFIKVLEGIELEGYNIVGDGTPQALLPLLTGKTESELPESRRGFPNAQEVDGHPWIWKDFKNAGYITQWSEDMAHIGTFNLRMMGFKEQPVDHYMRPFYLTAEKIYSHNKPYCLGATPRHKVMMDWIKDSFKQYTNKLKFIFGFHSEYSHTDPNNLQWADNDFLEFLEFLNDQNHLNNTILILMSDHGSRFSGIRDTIQGKLEERLPYFAFRFPPWFKMKHSEIYNKFLSNAKKLTTPFDIHETFHDILNLTRLEIPNAESKTRGISLFKEIPKRRTCEAAGIEPHWCACLKWTEVPVDYPPIIFAVTKILQLINTLTESFRNICDELYLTRIKSAFKFGIDDDVLKYRGSSDLDGRMPKFGDFNQSVEELYQVTFITIPGNGSFEVTVKQTASDEIIVNSKHISRINRYGHDADCIINTAPHLRPYCYCK